MTSILFDTCSINILGNIIHLENYEIILLHVVN